MSDYAPLTRPTPTVILSEALVLRRNYLLFLAFGV